ncbi:MAG: hypothetical protein AB9M53_01050 [Leptothrix sp. (in: b-proteobacteria)]
MLASEIQNDPIGLGYAALLPDQPGHVVELMNARTQTMVRERFVTARGILAEVPGGAQILDKLEAVAPAVPEVKWALRFLVGELGIDIGHAQTRALIQALADQHVLTADDAAALLALAVQPASRAEVLGLAPITEEALRAAGVL